MSDFWAFDERLQEQKMDKIREQLKNPLVTGIAGLVIGLLLGWMVLGWWLFPVEWTDATPAYLRSDLKADYLRMAIDSYSKVPDKALAAQRWEDLGPDAGKVLADVQAAPSQLTPAEILAFSAAVETGELPALTTPAATQGTEIAPGQVTTAAVTPTATEAKPKTSTLTVVLVVLCLLALVIGGALAYIFLVRNKRRGNGEATPASEAAEFNRQVERTDYSAQGQEAPVAQFMSTYRQGDDLFDDSFSIDAPSGEFLGECGIGISDTIGVGDPKKVTAFEVWLFDKNDIQTVTKVLMSEHAFDDATIRARLESKGEPVLMEPGKRVLLETATLQLEARVVDMNYGQGALPANSYFDRLTLELAVWPKEQAAPQQA
jgi:hypothetical protein